MASDFPGTDGEVRLLSDDSRARATHPNRTPFHEVSGHSIPRSNVEYRSTTHWQDSALSVQKRIIGR